MAGQMADGVAGRYVRVREPRRLLVWRCGVGTDRARVSVRWNCDVRTFWLVHTDGEECRTLFSWSDFRDLVARRSEPARPSDRPCVVSNNQAVVRIRATTVIMLRTGLRRCWQQRTSPVYSATANVIVVLWPKRFCNTAKLAFQIEFEGCGGILFYRSLSRFFSLEYTNLV